MKRALNIASILAAILGIVLIASVLGRKQQPASKPSTVAFSGFPLNQPRFVEVNGSDEAFHQLTSREFSDQVRDWLLTTVVSDAGLSPVEVNQSLFDLPLVRYGYLRPVGSFDFGDTRARSIGNGRLVALIPKSDAGSRLDALARVADEARKNTGDKPGKVIAFEYEVSPDNLSAEVTRRPDIDGSSLFTEASGYVEVTVSSLEDLRGFMSGIDDLTFARLESAGLRLGGRKIQGHHHHDINLDDVAVLWSAQSKLRVKNDDFDRFVVAKNQEFKGRWNGRTYHTEYERTQLEAQRDVDLAKVQAEIDQERERLGVVRSTGFSLDPSFVFSKVQAELQGLLGEAMVRESHGAFSSYDLQKAAAQAGNGKLDPFYALLQKLDPDTARPMVQYLKAKCSYQAARYDGALQGTEVGMVLFYTDLLAKLWALDFMSSAPDKYIPDFHSMSHTVLSPIYNRQQQILPSTRLWFGVQSRGFALKNDGAPAIILAPVATRLYAASSDSITPGKEAAPNPASEAFLGWWDDHYAEVARFEPEYERLNEIMKWSILVSWLDDKGQLGRLSPLKDVTFKRDNFFPDWVQQHPDLRFQNWAHIGFYPRGYAKTEALPLLHSDPGLPRPLMGGVSLAEKEVIQARGAISNDIAEIGRRPTLKWDETTPDVFKTVEGAEYKFAQAADRYTMNATLKTGTKFRAPEEEVADLHYSRSISFENNGVRMEARGTDASIGELKIERGANSFRVGWQSREYDTAASLARKVSTAPDPAATIASDPRVATSVETRDHAFLVQLKGSSRWLKMAPERQPSADIAKGFESRVAPVDPHARSIDLAWYDSEKASAELNGAGYVRITPAASEGIRMRMAARPPPSAAETDLRLGGKTFRAQRDPATGDYYVRWADLPNDFAGGSRPRPIDELAAGQFQRVAHDLVRDPVAVKLALDQHYISGLKHADTLLVQGNDTDALRLLDELSNVHGNRPEIAVRRAIALTHRGNTGTAARALNNTMKAPLRDRIALFEEINARIRSTQNAAERSDLLQLAAFGDWSDMRTTGALRNGTPVATVDQGRLQIDYYATGGLKGTRVPDVPKGAPIYVQDTPGLSNLDSPAAIHQALHAGVQGKLPFVLKLNQDELGFFRPAKIYAADEKTSFRKVESTGKSTSKSAYRAYSNNQPCSAQDTRPECGNLKQPVYVVVDPSHAAQFN